MNAKFQDFVKCVFGSWFALMSGGTAVPLTIVGALATSNWVRATLYVTAALCLGLTFFYVWRVERLARTAAEKKLFENDSNFLALSIEFDPTNPMREFWSREQMRDPADQKTIVVYKECRVRVWNKSRKTVHGVEVFSRSAGAMAQRPQSMLFDINKSPIRDIHPFSSALVPVIQWPVHPQPGMAAGPSAAIYSPIEVTVTGRDVATVKRTFNFDWQIEPMIYD